LVFALGTLLAPRAALADVQAAYQKEFAFLEAEKVSLQKRLGALQAETEQKKVDAQAELDQLQGRILGLAAHADRMTEALSDVDRELDTAGDGEDLLDSVVAQATTALEKGGVQMPAAATEGDGRAAQIRFAIDNAVRLLGRYSTVLEEPGEFFAAAGEKVSGRIVRVGRIASYGVSADVAGALAPAGEDRLKLWPQGDTAAVARAIANGQSPPTFGMFLHESLDRDVELKQEKTVVEVIESGGVIGWVIVGAGVLAALMALARALLLLRAAANTNRLAERITPALEEKQFDRAIEICKKAKSAGGRVLVATLSHLGRDRVELEDIISEAILHEQPALDRFGSSIIVVAAVAPLLGLLGTVTGMIATFDIITEFGTGNPKLLSGGISIALVTTELGLIVAIPTLIVGNLLSAWAEGIKDGMDKAALRVVNISTGIRLSQRPVAAPGTDTDSANSNRPLAVV
jgi:biopolymer transport protein ExbB